jgi:hypothetical protein
MYWTDLPEVRERKGVVMEWGNKVWVLKNVGNFLTS